ncbi:LysR family transcriptional regulator [Motilimonas pumila]|uniref:LysR family transcriptional regulator n=1 Tax=Motilimonas pumila TaxID=2303987 RepID=A0A418YEF5_9GAMM|nr:LysR family transcriptional regulator [Motilimonas pumila]RJG47537.1 LysR family transcriptional regulator [Motilimonas pumila]
MNNKLDELDLNLLKLLKVVVATRNTSIASEKLGISQTSVSRGIAKLREAFGDQLFIRKAHGVEPSELAEQLAQAADNMLVPFNDVLMAYQAFDANEYEGEIVICLELSLLEIFGKELFITLRQALPKASFRLLNWQESSLRAILDKQINYMVHYSLLPLPQDIYSHHLVDIEVCLVARKNHPVLSQTTELEDIHHLPLVKSVSDSVIGKHDVLDEIFIENGYQPNLQLATHSVPVLLEALRHSDAYKFSSSHIAVQDEELACYPLPKKFNRYRKVSVSGGYLQAKRDDPLNQYLHQVIQGYFNSVNQPIQY